MGSQHEYVYNEINCVNKVSSELFPIEYFATITKTSNILKFWMKV